MTEYYKQELATMIEQWPVDRLDMYIRELEERVEATKEHIRALRAIKRRRNRNKNLKDTGSRSGI